MAKEKKQTDTKDASALARARAAIQKVIGETPITDTSNAYGYVSSGSFLTDMLIGGAQADSAEEGVMICPGFPRRRITEIYGPESSGKTTMLTSGFIQAQKAGGCAALVDFEHAYDKGYAKKQGLDLDPDKFLHYQPVNMEDGLKMVSIFIAMGVDIVGVDTVAAMVPEAEQKKKIGDAAKVGGQALALSQILPKFVGWLTTYPKIGEKRDPDHPGTALVLLNQTRMKIDIGGGGKGRGDNESTAGGKALKYYDFLRIRMAKFSSLYVKTKDLTGKEVSRPYGNVTTVKIVKNKMYGVQGASTQIFLRYGFGIDDYYSVIEAAIANKMIGKSGTWFTIGEERFQGKDKVRTYLLSHPEVYEDLKAKIAKTIIDSTAVTEELNEGDELVAGLEDMDLNSISGDDEVVVLEAGDEDEE